VQFTSFTSQVKFSSISGKNLLQYLGGIQTHVSSVAGRDDTTRPRRSARICFSVVVGTALDLRMVFVNHINDPGPML
jgi:hypothetical protein